MKVVPLSLRQANAWVEVHHRHSKPVRGMKFAIGAEQDGSLIGVAIVGRPVARLADDGKTAEILRVVTLGHRNANSFLYSRARRAAAALGYEKVITYNIPEESGASLRADGWMPTRKVAAQNWDRPGRRRDPDHHQVSERTRWERAAA